MAESPVNDFPNLCETCLAVSVAIHSELTREHGALYEASHDVRAGPVISRALTVSTIAPEREPRNTQRVRDLDTSNMVVCFELFFAVALESEAKNK